MERDVRGGPLEGVRIADFSYIIAGPLSTKVLGDYGAEVVNVENPSSLLMRTYTPYAGGKPGLNRSGAHLSLNSSKYSLVLDLQDPRAVEIALKLVAWSDVVVEQYAPGVMNKLGLGYERLREVKPDIIMLSMSGQGQSGPFAAQPAFGNIMEALTGLNHLSGWPDREPVAPFTPYPDYTMGYLAVALIAGAMGYRRRTGKGQYLDCNLFETAIQLLLPAMLDYTVNGNEQKRDGNRVRGAAPHGAYRCRGEDRWITIGVFSDAEWETLKEVMGRPGWAAEDRFSTMLGRKANEDELDRLVEAWTVGYPPEQLMAWLQCRGVCAAVVQTTREVCHDPHLRERGYLKRQPHREIGLWGWSAPSFQLSKTPFEPGPVPLVGEHTEYVCTKLLGIPESTFAELAKSGTFGNHV